MSDVSKTEMATVASIIARADDEQIGSLYRMANTRRAMINRINIRQIRVGAKVSWTGKLGPQWGVVVKVKQKYVEVKSNPSGLVWNVPAGMLKVDA